MPSPSRKTDPLFSMINSSLIDLPTPLNISSMWNFGSILLLCLGVQIVSGLFLSMHYCPSSAVAFSSVTHMMLDVSSGWFSRLLHTNTASIFFLFIYSHMTRGIFYSSYYNTHTWNSGVILFILLMASAFMGYVLPWGQMSLWALTVITNLMSAIPYLGPTIVYWFWGGFCVDSPTLNRLFTLHFIIPLLMLIFVVLHILFLHQAGSSNPLGLNSNSQKIPFHPYHSWKDLEGILLALGLIFFLTLIFPYTLTDPENFIPANPMVTPIHIKPEWYFLWSYAILRSVPNKLGGVLMMFSAMLILLVLPLSSPMLYKPPHFSNINNILIYFLIAIFMCLTWIGGSPVEPPYLTVGQILTFMYFSTIMTIMLKNKYSM